MTKPKAIRRLLPCLSVALLAFGCGGKPTVNLGDSSSGNLIWGVNHYGFEERDLGKAVAYADKMLEIHGDEARRLQASLSGFPPTDPPEETYRYNDLNHVGLALLTKGEFLVDQGDRAGAGEAFSMVIREFGYAQIQDLGEWGDYASSVPRDPRGFLRIADVARQRLADLEAGAD